MDCKGHIHRALQLCYETRTVAVKLRMEGAIEEVLGQVNIVHCIAYKKNNLS